MSCFKPNFFQTTKPTIGNHRPKHGNKKVTRVISGKVETFDSKKEAKRYDELFLLQRAKVISDLEIQPEFLLFKAQKHNGVTYKSVKYIADFKYIKDGVTYVEDVKSEHTSKLSTYRVKIKWFLSIYGNEVTFLEV